MFDNMSDTQMLQGKFNVVWSRKGTGFGEFRIYVDKDGVLRCSNECMSKDFIKEVLCALVDEMELDE